VTHDQKRAQMFTPLFVGGSWRSGTTLLHALICTSRRVNDYIGESSYFSALVRAMWHGLETFSIHTKYYFSSREEFIAHHTSILRDELQRVWERTDRPAILALKDPLLTPLFPLLASTLPEARFVISVRDPLDTLSSRIDVHRRSNGLEYPTNAQVRQFCHEYSTLYHEIIYNLENFGDRLCLINYRSIVEDDLAKLQVAGLDDIDPQHIWRSSMTNVHDHAGDPWLTPLYGMAPSTASIGRHRGKLTKDLEVSIMEICGNVWRQLEAIADKRPATTPMAPVGEGVSRS
jgi:hypothetical protein